VTVRTQLDQPLHEAVVVLQSLSDGSPSRLDWTDNAGTRCFDDVPSGSAVVVVHEPFHWRPAIREIAVPTSTVEFTLETGVAVDDAVADWEWGWSYGQSFVADGDALLKASIRIASEPQGISLMVREQGPSGSAVCAGRLSAGNGGRDTMAWGSRDGCPLVVGETYFLDMVPETAAQSGWAPYIDRANSYAGGQGFSGSDSQSWDVGVTLDMDHDELVTEHSVVQGDCRSYGQSFGQSFVAEGRSLRSAGFVIGGFSGQREVALRVLDSGGSQVGPTRIASPYGDNLAVVGWAAGEVPLEIGSTYVVEIAGGEGFCMYAAADTSSSGWLELDGAALDGGAWDAWARIMSDR
jgi:hypothetical protein